MKITVDVHVDSKISDKTIDRAVERAAQDAIEELGEYALGELRSNMGVFKNPTGAFEDASTVTFKDGEARVFDPLPYDTWLEWGGRGSFSGYGLFRKAATSTRDQVDRVVKDEVRRELRAVM